MAKPKWKIVVLNGPNLNRLGQREPELYGRKTLAEVNAELTIFAERFEAAVTCRQSNSEGKLINWIQSASDCDALIINPAGYTHTSVAIRDALIELDLPIYEVHISNVYARESFRHESLCADIVTGRIIGCGTYGYALALLVAIEYLQQQQETDMNTGE